MNERKILKYNLIFDRGSQRTYVSQRVVYELKLDAIDSGDMRINAFGTTVGKISIC